MFHLHLDIGLYNLKHIFLICEAAVTCCLNVRGITYSEAESTDHRFDTDCSGKSNTHPELLAFVDSMLWILSLLAMSFSVCSSLASGLW